MLNLVLEQGRADPRYQLTQDGLCRHAKIDEAAAGEVMRSAIPLAGSSSSSGTSGASLTHTSHGVVLSIGPFGATCSPGQEYAGIYPPPYGPGSSSNACPASAREGVISALTEFHLRRLITFSEYAETWAKVEWIAFETIPVLTEYTAIRRAMAGLQKAGRATGKRFWITSAFPDGVHPQIGEDGSHATVADVLVAARGEARDDDGADLPAADGVGANCTNPRFVDALSKEFREAVLSVKQEGQDKPTLVLYPDGGSVYDVVTRTWSTGSLDSTSWGKQVAEIARRAEEVQVDGQAVWEGVIVGGCCKAGFDEIRALRTALDG